MKPIALLFLICVSKFMPAQKAFNENWITGAGKSFVVSFNPTPTVKIFDSNYNYYFSKGSSCISNANSRLQLICNGYQIYDSNGLHLLNGDSLVPEKIYNRYNGFSIYTQTSIILPFPQGIYYCITPTVSDQEYQNSWGLGGWGHFDLLLYHKIDLTIIPNGAVTKKAIPLIQGQYIGRPQMMACRHADGMNWWLLKPYRGSNIIHKFVFTQDSVYDMGVQSFNIPGMNMNDLSGQIDIDVDGTRYTSVVQGSDEIFLCDFDRCSGAMTNPRTYKIPDSARAPSNPTPDTEPSGVCFSPDGRFLYLSKYWNIFQLDLLDSDTLTQWYHVVNLDTSEQMFMGYGNLYRGVDSKIYIGNWNGTSAEMSVINNPNAKGAACNFCARCLHFPKTGATHPPCMPNYALGKDTTVNCWPMGLPGVLQEQEELLTLYPNPAHGQLTVESEGLKKGWNTLRLFNLMGQCVLEEKFKTASGRYTVGLGGLAEGVYVVRVNGGAKRLVVSR